MSTRWEPLNPTVIDSPGRIRVPQSLPVRVWRCSPFGRALELMWAPQGSPPMVCGLSKLQFQFLRVRLEVLVRVMSAVNPFHQMLPLMVASSSACSELSELCGVGIGSSSAGGASGWTDAGSAASPVSGSLSVTMLWK